MKKADKAALVIQTLEQLYPRPSIPLQHTDPFTLLVSVLLSAQCTDERVNQVTPRLWKLARTPEEMTRLTQAQILEVVRPCGLGPAKSKAILGLSKILVEKYLGNIPTRLEELEALPGVGHKTASVMMIQAFNTPAFPVDTHIHRLMYRWGLSSGQSVVQTERDAKKIFPEKLWSKLHLQMIYFGREHCPARGHNPLACPLCSRLGMKSRMEIRLKK